MLDGACRVRFCLKGSSLCRLTAGEGRVSNDKVSQCSPDIYGLQKYLSDEQNYMCPGGEASCSSCWLGCFGFLPFPFFAHFIIPSLSQPVFGTLTAGL